MIRDPFGQTATHGHGINVGIAIVISAEGDDRAVWRKARESFLAARRTEPLRGAPFLRRDPDVAGIDKRDLRC